MQPLLSMQFDIVRLLALALLSVSAASAKILHNSFKIALSGYDVTATPPKKFAVRGGYDSINYIYIFSMIKGLWEFNNSARFQEMTRKKKNPQGY